MASNHTSNYQLNQWEPEDKVLRTEFNEDNLKIDEALAGLVAEKASASELTAVAATVPKIVTGTYTGDGGASRIINVGFRPKAVLLFHQSGRTGYQNNDFICMGGLILDGFPLKAISQFGDAVGGEICSSGFTVKVFRNASEYLDVRTNQSEEIYYYVALR